MTPSPAWATLIGGGHPGFFLCELVVGSTHGKNQRIIRLIRSTK